MSELLTRLRAGGALSALDAELARGLGALSESAPEDVLLAVALASRATRNGHVCAGLGQLAGSELKDDEDAVIATCPALDAWRSVLSQSQLVSDGGRLTPLVLDARDRLYLRRYWEDEQRLARALLVQSRTALEPSDPVRTRALVGQLFGEARSGELDRQRLAAQLSVLSALTVVSGGPGTGKTTTVVKILALALADAMNRGVARPRALLLAPTGKAAARLAEAVASAAAGLAVAPELVARIPTAAQTIHRALEMDRQGRFRIDQERPFFADVVIVDEASMVDVSLMRRVTEAVPPGARLILLGDRHQLSSVEAGAVLADICGDRPIRYGRALAERFERVYGAPLPSSAEDGGPPCIDDSVVVLEKSYRFSEASGLGALSAAIVRGDADAALEVLRAKDDSVALVTPHARRSLPRLAELASTEFTEFAKSADPAEALSRLGRFRVLCAHRRGPCGVEETNAMVERTLLANSALSSRASRGVVHPILVHENDASLDLFNGDVGVLFREPSSLRAYFKTPGGAIRALSPSRLPSHEPAFAMSVHKSQGSEFDRVLVVLPEPGSPLLTRELLYTAVTRARRRVVVHATEASIREAVARPATRGSGLADALRRERQELVAF